MGFLRIIQKPFRNLFPIFAPLKVKTGGKENGGASQTETNAVYTLWPVPLQTGCFFGLTEAGLPLLRVRPYFAF